MREVVPYGHLGGRDRHTYNASLEATAEDDRGTAHPTADVENAAARLNLRTRCKFDDQLLLGFFFCFIPCLPIAVMDMDSPKIPIKRAEFIVMAGNSILQSRNVAR